jgi:hypothetical protein
VDIRDQMVLRFRCAETARHFLVVVGRLKATNAFRILRVEAEAGGTATRDAFTPKNVSTTSFPVSTLSSIDVDLSGWFCPCCGHNRDGRAVVEFVQCSRCGELVCGGRTIQIPNGPVTFACSTECGNTGRVSGTIGSYGATSIPKQPLPSVADAGALPPSLPGLLERRVVCVTASMIVGVSTLKCSGS